MVLISEWQIATTHPAMFQTATPPAGTPLKVVIDFGADGTVAEHTHTDDEFVTVITGELTFRLEGVAQVPAAHGLARTTCGASA